MWVSLLFYRLRNPRQSHFESSAYANFATPAKTSTQPNILQINASTEHPSRFVCTDTQLDALFLTLPISWHGTIAQYVGRLHRLYDGKREVRIYDYADLNVPMLARMIDRRCRGYEAVGYSISLPASAVPGWFADVVLPSDPEWKRDYASTVRRLIRDGVDTPLANLFVRAVKTITAGSDRD